MKNRTTTSPAPASPEPAISAPETLAPVLPAPESVAPVMPAASAPPPTGGPSYPTAAFDYELPEDRIARFPQQHRDESRLLTLNRESGRVAHRSFRDLLELIPAGDTLVLNETRVFPARLRGRRQGGGEAEILLLHPVVAPGAQSATSMNAASGAPAATAMSIALCTDATTSRSSALGTHATAATVGAREGTLWEAMVRPGAKLKPGRVVEIAEDLQVEIVDSTPDGTRLVRLRTPLAIESALERYGRIPLPPYIARDPAPEDAERYQTVYAREQGSIAAPTAGLHFTPALLAALEEKGVRIARIVLHVGVGTFRPVEAEDPAEHRMHRERYLVTPEAAATINEVRGAGGKVWAVGTTVCRTLEAIADEHGTIRPGEGWTDLFIRPPYRFRVVDRLITNFHLPRSTLLMLVAALAGYGPTMHAYREAIAEGYRFYSYGDAMVVW